MISDRLKQLLKDHADDLKNNNLDPIFRVCSTAKSVGELRDLLLQQGIDPLEYVTKIPYRYFYDEELDTLDLSKYTNLKRVESQAFYNCNIKNDLILPDSIEEIWELALSFTVSNLYLPNNLKEVNNEAFEDLVCDNIIYKGRKYDAYDIIEALQNDGVKIF